MWYIYILYSEKINQYYTGVAQDLLWRLKRHNAGWGRYTKREIPWKIVHHEEYNTKSAALKREREIKNRKSRVYIESLLNK